mmetsp:Transcript_45680/g.74564  ORF Transcript_45680/g.74564 Transcript_45680/m.74564 type:complete len:104 (-) Transcript_45680:711-1022(-)
MSSQYVSVHQKAGTSSQLKFTGDQIAKNGPTDARAQQPCSVRDLYAWQWSLKQKYEAKGAMHQARYRQTEATALQAPAMLWRQIVWRSITPAIIMIPVKCYLC